MEFIYTAGEWTASDTYFVAAGRNLTPMAAFTIPPNDTTDNTETLVLFYVTKNDTLAIQKLDLGSNGWIQVPLDQPQVKVMSTSRTLAAAFVPSIQNTSSAAPVYFFYEDESSHAIRGGFGDLARSPATGFS